MITPFSNFILLSHLTQFTQISLYSSFSPLFAKKKQKKNRFLVDDFDQDPVSETDIWDRVDSLEDIPLETPTNLKSKKKRKHLKNSTIINLEEPTVDLEERSDLDCVLEDHSKLDLIFNSDEIQNDIQDGVETTFEAENMILNLQDIKNAIFSHKRPWPKLNPSDITESFITGFGKGGQKVNNTKNCVQLKHIPTGIVVKCQQTRSQNANRHIAKKILSMKIDQHLFSQSKSTINAEKIRKKKARIRRRAKMTAQMLKEGTLQRVKKKKTHPTNLEDEIDTDSEFSSSTDDDYLGN